MGFSASKVLGTFKTRNCVFCSERAKGAAKASCGETVVQKGVFGESVSSLPPFKVCSLFKHMKTLRGQRGNELSKNTLLDDPSGPKETP